MRQRKRDRQSNALEYCEKKEKETDSQTHWNTVRQGKRDRQSNALELGDTRKERQTVKRTGMR